MVEAATVHMGFLEEGASDRVRVGAATRGGGQEAGDMRARVAVANNGWMATVGTMAVSILHEAVEALSKRAATAEVAGVGKKMAEVAM